MFRKKYTYTRLPSFQPPDRLKAVTISKRRTLTLALVFFSLTFALVIRTARHRYRVRLEEEGQPGFLGASVPGVVYDKSDEWVPPAYWDPVVSVYDSFTDLIFSYASNVNNLTNTGWTPGKHKATIYNAYPDYYSGDYKQGRPGVYVPCVGPKGTRLNETTEFTVKGYLGTPKGWPEPLHGSSTLVGLNDNTCFEREGRFGAYGLKKQQTGSKATSEKSLDWNSVDWGTLQTQCVQDNRERFNLEARAMPGEEDYVRDLPLEYEYDPRPKTRTAILFRSYDGFKYTSDAIRTMRAIITEMALQSGGEYEAFLLVQVKDKSIPIFKDQEAYDSVIHNSIPKEFWNMTILWNEGLWGKLYPKLPERARLVHVSQWLPIQWFAQQHPNFDFYWNWEMDVRYTGHYYQFAEKAGEWAREQPRKGLWERNMRFYIPKFHGDYVKQFTPFIQKRYETYDKKGHVVGDSSIWGPNPPPNQATTPFDDFPPLNTPTPMNENFTWGVGEEADLITFLPMFNPDTTHYALRNIYYNYPKILNPKGGPPRRATIITFYRISHRLLSTMHLENTRDPGHHMSSETWPQGAALHHGFKAVYVPHSIYDEKQWPAKATDFIFNNGDSPRVINVFKDVPPVGEGSGGWESPFGFDREHNFHHSSWYYRSSLSATFYKRLLGYEVDGIGGKEWEAKHGKYCMPGVLLHPIKDVEDPGVAAAQEKAAQEAEQKEKEAEAARKAEEEKVAAQEQAELEKVTEQANEDKVGLESS